MIAILDLDLDTAVICGIAARHLHKLLSARFLEQILETPSNHKDTEVVTTHQAAVVRNGRDLIQNRLEALLLRHSSRGSINNLHRVIPVVHSIVLRVHSGEVITQTERVVVHINNDHKYSHALKFNRNHGFHRQIEILKDSAEGVPKAAHQREVVVEEPEKSEDWAKLVFNKIPTQIV